MTLDEVREEPGLEQLVQVAAEIDPQATLDQLRKARDEYHQRERARTFALARVHFAVEDALKADALGALRRMGGLITELDRAINGPARRRRRASARSAAA